MKQIYKPRLNSILAFIKPLILGVVVLSISSCKKYLDQKPNNFVVAPQTIDELQAMLDDGRRMNEVVTPSYGEGSTDNVFWSQTDYNSQLSAFSKDAYIWKPTFYDFRSGNDWSFSYLPVYNSNYCVEMIEKIPITNENEVKWKNVKGSALFFRAYHFLNLAWNYAKAFDATTSTTDLGIVLRLGSDFNEPSQRSTVKETYEQIIKDAGEAIQYLPDLPLHSFRPSKAAAYGLLARAYLSMRDYPKALHYSNLYLGLKNDLIDFNVNNSNDFFTPSAAFPVKRFNKETVFYTEINGFIGLLVFTRAKIDTNLVAQFATNDIRRTAFFKNDANPNYRNFKGSYSQGGFYFTGIATDEMYLTRAECHARLNDKDAALSDLNTLLVRRFNATFTPVSTSTAAEALEAILTERRKELIFRGLRWMDIKRLNKEGRNIVLTRIANGQTYTLQPNTNYYALPLPSDIIALTGIPQNPYP